MINGNICHESNLYLKCILKFIISQYVGLVSGILFYKKYDLSTANSVPFITGHLSTSPPKWASPFAAIYFENESFS